MVVKSKDFRIPHIRRIGRILDLIVIGAPSLASGKLEFDGDESGQRFSTRESIAAGRFRHPENGEYRPTQASTVPRDYPHVQCEDTDSTRKTGPGGEDKDAITNLLGLHPPGASRKRDIPPGMNPKTTLHEHQESAHSISKGALITRPIPPTPIDKSHPSSHRTRAASSAPRYLWVEREARKVHRELRPCADQFVILQRRRLPDLHRSKKSGGFVFGNPLLRRCRTPPRVARKGGYVHTYDPRFPGYANAPPDRPGTQNRPYYRQIDRQAPPNEPYYRK